MVLFWGLLILVAVALVRAFAGKSSTGGTHDKSAREILDERFARGEIDEDEYDRKRKQLM